MATYERLDNGSPDGSQWGGSATADKIAFFGVTPIVQRVGSGTPSNQAALTTALASVTVTGAYGFALSSGYSAMLALVEEIRATLVAFGLMKGSN
jgi:hypothetical protein